MKLAAWFGLAPAAYMALVITLPGPDLASGEGSGAWLPTIAGTESPDFVNDVMPVLTAAGCNTGDCHGAALGQNRFKLSLLGYDPRADWEALTRDLRGRRIQQIEPEDSLLLRKPSERTHHGGGLVLEADSEGYQLLLRWIESGAPYRTVERELERIEVVEDDGLRVTAIYDDGTRRDVTEWALVTSNDESIAWVEGAQWSEREDGRIEIEALRPGQTSVIVRYGGKLAVVPVTTPFGQVEFEYEPLGFVDELVAEQWRRMGVAPPERCSDATFLRRVTLDLTGRLPSLEQQAAFERDPDRDRLVDGLIASDAFAEFWAYRLAELLPTSPKLVGWLRTELAAERPWTDVARTIMTATGHQPGTALFSTNDPKMIAENLFESFLGKQIQCAQCHNHPFMSFSQDDYFGVAAFFARVRIEDTGLQLASRGEVRTLDTGEVVHPTFPGGVAPSMEPDGDRRWALADWVVERDDFARLMANRVWAALMGEGLVEPVDDLRPSNPASNEALLAALAADFTEHDSSLQHLVGVIARSDAYGRLKQPRLMPAAVLVDAIADATGVPDAKRAVQNPTMDSATLDVSGRRSDFSGSLAQSLHLITSEAVNAKVARMENMDLDEIYRRALGRGPTGRERELAPTSREGLEDLMWALLNSEEFLHVR
ncbi:DUF1549 domain-containing protein [Engelhardtia mirabilis]|uniref:DUF1549 domain-containing protein n=1 Tax=Engelhardtia mirabilis TaxID=2528011 RepID=A0A518BLQ5_9BACT|nr:hypothetical protein Pla133_29920 [Planctomycetes bacterium Pla133]QDV02229.1 hypothetical protein Pla86_29910 [Planctomycetes bacterium Pla86]